MNKELLSKPDEIVIFGDEDAEKLIFELGFADKFTRKVPANESRRQLVICTEHPTHWVIAIFYTGNPDQKENGFVTQCYPRTRVNPEQLIEIAQKEHGFTPENVLEIRGFGGQPNRN
jgi:hypothetical protein